MPSLEVVEVPIEEDGENEEEEQLLPPCSSSSGGTSADAASPKKKRKITPSSTTTAAKSSSSNTASKLSTKKKKKLQRDKNQLTLGSFFTTTAAAATKKKTCDAKKPSLSNSSSSTKTPMATASTKITTSTTTEKLKAPSQLDYMAETRKSELRDIVVGKKQTSQHQRAAAAVVETVGKCSSGSSTTTTTATTTRTSSSSRSSTVEADRDTKPSPNRLFLEDDEDDATQDTILATADESPAPSVTATITKEKDYHDDDDKEEEEKEEAEGIDGGGSKKPATGSNGEVLMTGGKESPQEPSSSAIISEQTKDESFEETTENEESVTSSAKDDDGDDGDGNLEKKPTAAKTTTPGSSKRTTPRTKKVTTKSKGTEDSPIELVDNNNAATEKHPDSSTKTPSTKASLASPLSKEAQDLLTKHSTMRETYCRRANELLRRCRSGLDAEAFEIPAVAETKPDDYTPNDDTAAAFPDFAIKTVAALVEGRNESLSVLASSVVDSLTKLYDGEVSFPIDAVTAKIKLLASRKNYIKNPAIASGLSIAGSTTAAPTNVFEDEEQDHLWRWEVSLTELLPETCVSKVKKARTARKKIGSHFNALAKLLSSVNDADALIQGDGCSTSKKSKLDSVLAKISQEEEKVLKYEREEEKSRLAAQSQQTKEAAKAEARAKKELEKQQAAENKRKEKERKKEEAQRKKEEVAEAKRLKEAKQEEERAQKEAALNKQKNMMNSFFAAPAKKKRAPLQQVNKSLSSTAAQKEASASAKSDATGAFDTESFRAAIGSNQALVEKPFPYSSLSKRARSSRKRRSKRVTISVFVTVYPEEEVNAFAAQPYAEQQDVEVVNKYKFLSFHGDVRPAYYGTWSKKSKIVTGTTPFAKDTSFLDYDVDSEAEWEEGDDEIGEELGDDKADADEDMKMEVGGSGDDDGWLAADDEVDEDLDEETKELRKKKNMGKDDEKRVLTVSIVAPCGGGKPLALVTPDGTPTPSNEHIEGYTPIEAMELVEKLSATRLQPSELVLDAFPPSDDFDANHDPSAASAHSTNSSSQTMSDENMKCFARFVHNCTLGSKDKVIDELLKAHNTVTSSRAQAIRVLDSIADKKKHPRNGVFWEVKRDVLASLGLGELIDTSVLETDDTKQEAMKTIARFVHNNTTASKEKIVDDLRIEHDSVTSSRAEATRILTQISEKKKHPDSGYYWEVKEDVREELGLTDLPSSPPKIANSAKKTKASQSSGNKATLKANAIGESISPQKEAKTPGSTSSSEQSSGQKRQASGGSAKLLAAFVKKKSKKST